MQTPVARLPKSCALPVVAIVIKFIVSMGFVDAFLPPPITPLVEFDSPPDLETLSVNHQSLVHYLWLIWLYNQLHYNKLQDRMYIPQ